MRQYLLQDSRGCTGNNMMFWALDGNGYTTNLDKSEPYSRETALRQNDSRETDIPWPLEYLRRHARPVVDVQYVRREEAFAKESEEFFIQVTGDFNGNDMLWVQETGYGEDLSRARIFRKDELYHLAEGRVAWPVEYIRGKIRYSVSRKAVSLKEAYAGDNIQLKMPAKPKKEVYRCEGCKRYMTLRNYYSGPCAHCKTDNRP